MVGIEIVEPADVPVIDLNALSSPSPAERGVALAQLDEAYRTYGAIWLVNHSIGVDLVEEALAWCQRFFQLPREQKQTVSMPTKNASERIEGWSDVGASISSQGDPTSEAAQDSERLRKLDQMLPGFPAFIERWWDACFKQQTELMRCLCEILGIADIDFIVKQQQTPRHGSTHLTWNYFLGMPLSPLSSGSANRLNPHTDYGQLTLLFQDMQGGLEILDPVAGIYRPVPPLKGAMIIQVGDILEKQSNGRWRSPLHRVTAPNHLMYGGNPGERSDQQEDALVSRCSIVFLCYPGYETVIEHLPGCEKKGNWKTLEWEGNMTAGEWIKRRAALEYERPE
ncbi:Oxoglutarate/iron-dependent dioxygenase [Penicillium expansum]|nr:Oxoglutarate/iron-dependent dioxygenase [Penicillium expansum]